MYSVSKIVKSFTVNLSFYFSYENGLILKNHIFALLYRKYAYLFAYLKFPENRKDMSVTLLGLAPVFGETISWQSAQEV
jgi:hypothetical protein